MPVEASGAGREIAFQAIMGFELERFQWTANDRLEVAGRWFDVRGRRFLRPTLEVEIDGRTRRLLATLEHKPWTADEGEEWLAAFQWDAGAAEIDAAELTVGPDLAVKLAPPRSAGDGRRPARGGGDRELEVARAEIKRIRAGLERERAALPTEVADRASDSRPLRNQTARPCARRTRKRRPLRLGSRGVTRRSSMSGMGR